MNWVIHYDTDRPVFEWFIDGVSKGAVDAGPGSFAHKGVGNARFQIGAGWSGFISQMIVMTPGVADMSNYFATSGTGICSGLTACMTDPAVVTIGDCPEITK